MQFRFHLLSLLRSNLVLMLTALLGGVLAAASGQHYLQQRARQLEADVATRYAMTQVVVAKRDLDSGELLGADLLALRSVPRAYLPGGSIAAEEAGVLIGRRLAADVSSGEALQRALLQPVQQSLARTLPETSRALTLAVDDLNAHAGLLRAGDHVDVYLVERVGARSRIGLLQEKLRVLATGSRTEAVASAGASTPDFGTITLQVDDAQARRLTLARQSGELSFVLRAEGDMTPASTLMLDSGHLLAPAAGGPGTARPVSQPADAIELLIGGGGGPSPARHWLRVGAPRRGAGGA